MAPPYADGRERRFREPDFRRGCRVKVVSQRNTRRTKNMESLGRKIRMSFVNASDGPRIMLFGPMDVDLLTLQHCFRELSKGGKEIRLERQAFLHSFGGVELAARCAGSMAETKGLGKQGRLIKKSKEAAHFEWTRSAEGWDYLAELMDGLIRSKTAGHQYLTNYPKDDAIVVVSKGEYSDELLQA